MSTLNRREIRKALEAPLRPGLVTAGACLMPDGSAAVLFPNTALETATLTEWVRFSVHFAGSRVIEMGRNPLTQDSGQLFAMIYTRGASGADRGDTIAGIIETIYPYDAELTFGGVSVIVAEVAPADPGPDGPWWTTPVKILWNRWRNL